MDSLNSHDLQTISLKSYYQTQNMLFHHQNIDEKDTVSTKGFCKVAPNTVQRCCDTTCVAFVATLATPHILITASTSLALITSPISGDVILRTENLYRPPLA
ncbi:hypothetical protein EDB38_12020 [Vibrio crassostreae]|nr:hypothetical protein EDB58_11272 [Vibrio crassostreae]TCL18843.1 hypothetical protein EDB52_11762 [Vibrio crassostreae]TCN05057.1 hypothetical protein EDB35_11950 [Vibrio crassostreae]TCN91583.1 hypothetical protein EDB50_11814 [Vibrio crassostreae]TCN96089.1 hypothetical protein EDB30_11971 [Vibrio crassostreae]